MLAINELSSWGLPTLLTAAFDFYAAIGIETLHGVSPHARVHGLGLRCTIGGTRGHDISKTKTNPRVNKIAWTRTDILTRLRLVRYYAGLRNSPGRHPGGWG